MDISGLLFNGLPPDDASSSKIVRAEFNGHFVARAEVDSVSAHVSAEMCVDFVFLVVLEGASECPTFEDLLDDGALVDSHLFIAHILHLCVIH